MRTFPIPDVKSSAMADRLTGDCMEFAMNNYASNLDIVASMRM